MLARQSTTSAIEFGTQIALAGKQRLVQVSVSCSTTSNVTFQNLIAKELRVYVCMK
jgi:hypothetical protein